MLSKVYGNEKFKLTAVQASFLMYFKGDLDLTTRIKEAYHAYDFN